MSSEKYSPQYRVSEEAVNLIAGISAAPVENIVWENQSGCYLAIQRSTLLANSESFIDFMIESILQAIKVKGEELKNVGVKLSARERDPLKVSTLPLACWFTRDGEVFSYVY